MGGICSSKPVAIPNAFDPKDYIPIDVHEEELARSAEQRNLLRFKVEVLINMLANSSSCTSIGMQSLGSKALGIATGLLEQMPPIFNPSDH